MGQAACSKPVESSGGGTQYPIQQLGFPPRPRCPADWGARGGRRDQKQGSFSVPRETCSARDRVQDAIDRCAERVQGLRTSRKSPVDLQRNQGPQSAGFVGRHECVQPSSCAWDGLFQINNEAAGDEWGVGNRGAHDCTASLRLDG